MIFLDEKNSNIFLLNLKKIAKDEKIKINKNNTQTGPRYYSSSTFCLIEILTLYLDCIWIKNRKEQNEKNLFYDQLDPLTFFFVLFFPRKYLIHTHV